MFNVSRNVIDGDVVLCKNYRSNQKKKVKLGKSPLNGSISM